MITLNLRSYALILSCLLGGVGLVSAEIIKDKIPLYVYQELNESYAIISYFDKQGNLVDHEQDSVYYRELLAVNIDGSFLVQDFYTASGNKFSDPYHTYHLQRFDIKYIEGDYVLWYETGVKQMQSFIEEGNYKGNLIIWYESGQKIFEVINNDEMNSVSIFWYKNGNKWVEAPLVNGKKTGCS